MAARLDKKTPLGKLILTKLYLIGKNQAWLAEQIGVAPSYISVLCSQIQSPKADTLKKISKLLDITLSELYNAIAQSVEDTP